MGATRSEIDVLLNGIRTLEAVAARILANAIDELDEVAVTMGRDMPNVCERLRILERIEEARATQPQDDEGAAAEERLHAKFDLIRSLQARLGEAKQQRNDARAELAEAQGKLKRIWVRCGGEHYSVQSLREIAPLEQPIRAAKSLLVADILEILAAPNAAPPCPRCNDSGVIGSQGFEGGSYTDTTRECPECSRHAEQSDDPAEHVSDPLSAQLLPGISTRVGHRDGARPPGDYRRC